MEDEAKAADHSRSNSTRRYARYDSLGSGTYSMDSLGTGAQGLDQGDGQGVFGSARSTIEDLLRLRYDPPEPTRDEEDEAALNTKSCFSTILKHLTPLEVKEVDPKHKRSACTVWTALVMGFIVCALLAIIWDLRQRNNPPTRIEAKGEESWSLPNMVVCDIRAEAVDWPLQSGWHDGYNQSLTRAGIPMSQLVTVLDPSCPRAKDRACFWLDFDHLYPDDINAPIANKKMVMDMLYFPSKWNPSEYRPYWPNNYAAHIVFTNLTMDAWCSASESDAYRNTYPLPISQLFNDQTRRTYAFLTKQRVVDFIAEEGDVKARTVLTDQYILRTQAIPVTNALSMLNSFTWYAPCSLTDKTQGKNDCKDSCPQNLQNAQEHNATAQAILLTFIQDPLVVTYREVDPVSLVNLAGNIGGFWAYVSLIFALIYSRGEAGSKKPNSLLHRRRWKHFVGRIRRKSEEIFLSKGKGGISKRELHREDSWVKKSKAKEAEDRYRSMEGRVHMLELVLKAVMKAPLIVDDRRVLEHMSFTLSEGEEDSGSGGPCFSSRFAPPDAAGGKCEDEVGTPGTPHQGSVKLQMDDD